MPSDSRYALASPSSPLTPIVSCRCRNGAAEDEPMTNQLHAAGCECISTEPDTGECRGCGTGCAPCYCLTECEPVPAPILPSLVSAPEAKLNGGGL